MLSAKETSRPNTKDTEFDIPALPFNLNNLVSVQFDNLTAAIEYLARQVGEHQVLINELIQ